MPMIIATAYNSDHKSAVRLGDTLRVLVRAPDDGNTWTGNLTIRTSYSASATDDVALADYTGAKVRGESWDLVKEYDTSTIPLAANTRYLAVAELTSGSKTVEYHTAFNVLPQGRS